MDDHAGLGSFTEVSEGADQPFLGDNNVDAGVDEGLNQPLKVFETVRGVIGCAVVDGDPNTSPVGQQAIEAFSLVHGPARLPPSSKVCLVRLCIRVGCQPIQGRLVLLIAGVLDRLSERSRGCQRGPAW